MGYIEKASRLGGVINDAELDLATATESAVLNGKTFYSGDKELKTGNLVTTAATSFKGADRTSLSGLTVGKRYLVSVVYDANASISLTGCSIITRYNAPHGWHGGQMYQFVVTATSSTITHNAPNGNWSGITALALN